ncbi:MAG TPA: poly-gamma-glutamate biosynthesis protein PgsC [Myxococcota bacterium]|nr:poly-gamma-glutamate biosynthesis protein PgsC [Myxococcota bacterium]
MNESDIVVIGLGLVLSLVMSEFLGVAPGGIIVPGYLALGLHDPLAVAITFAIAGVTFFIVRALATVAILYGRRRTVLMILIGFLLGSLIRTQVAPGAMLGPFAVDVVGYIVPGLIAIWMDRQGTIVTLTAAFTATIATRMSAIVLLGV